MDRAFSTCVLTLAEATGIPHHFLLDVTSPDGVFAAPGGTPSALGFTLGIRPAYSLSSPTPLPIRAEGATRDIPARGRKLRLHPFRPAQGAACRRPSFTGSPSTTLPTATSAATTPAPRTRTVTTGRSRRRTWQRSPPSRRPRVSTGWRSVSPRSQAWSTSEWSRRSGDTASPGSSRPTSPATTTGPRFPFRALWSLSEPCSVTRAPGAGWRWGTCSPCTSGGTSTCTWAATSPARTPWPVHVNSAFSRNR